MLLNFGDVLEEDSFAVFFLSSPVVGLGVFTFELFEGIVGWSRVVECEGSQHS